MTRGEGSGAKKAPENTVNALAPARAATDDPGAHAPPEGPRGRDPRGEATPPLPRGLSESREPAERGAPPYPLGGGAPGGAVPKAGARALPS
jgi:hypothetical protein